MPSLRLDQALVERGLCPSRENAKRAILAGRVRLNDRIPLKASDTVKAQDTLTLEATERFVSRGGQKLEHGLRHFGLSARGVTAIDLGASTGGFTDCLLQHGAATVYAVDVGSGQLAWKLRRDARVKVMEKINARFLTRRDFGPAFAGADLIVADCSFISLKKILPPAIALLNHSGKIVALVKPQFEAGKAEASKGRGVITDPAVHARVLNELKTFVSDNSGMRWTGETESPLLGPAGNKEFLVLLEKQT
ncbi:MAG TPA: TlyA family RNA methyltransferase [Verrucomicrobiae bacterium]|jgi:23S rRNA (cytidine1920-2'-O)/16S rRNA (cytidine1409-2'-O)-methyltransferase|nr:TlyA family RNA methyltransferase [Verrucomicrobiae bacterium]